MNIPTPADPVMEMARKIAFQVWKERMVRRDRSIENSDWVASIQTAYDFGSYDRDIGVQSALAAIRATTEAAVALAESDFLVLSESRWPGSFGATRKNHGELIAAQIRASHHLKGSDDV